MFYELDLQFISLKFMRDVRFFNLVVAGGWEEEHD